MLSNAREIHIGCALSSAVAVEPERDGRVVDRRPVAAGAARSPRSRSRRGRCRRRRCAGCRRRTAGCPPTAGCARAAAACWRCRSGRRRSGPGRRSCGPVCTTMQLGAVVGELQLLHGQHAVGADAAGELVVEAQCRPRRWRRSARPGRPRVRAVDGREPSADVDRGVGGRERGGLAVGGGGEAGDGRARWSRLSEAIFRLVDAVDRVEGARDVQLGAVRRRLDRVVTPPSNVGPERACRSGRW